MINLNVEIEYTFVDGHEEDDEKIDFNYPEDVIFEVINLDDTGKNRSIENHIVINNSNITGTATYEDSYGCCMDYHIDCILEYGTPDGVYVLVDVTGYWTKGDGWTTDDDLDVYYDHIRPATPEEIGILFGVNFWQSL